MEKFDVIHKDKQVGNVEIIREGLFTTLQCKCTHFTQIMRLYGFLEEKSFAIGILTPSDKGLCLTKKYSKNDLKNIPIDNCTRFELCGLDEMPEEPKKSKPDKTEKQQDSLWKLVEDPASLFADPELKETAMGIKGGIVAQDGDTMLFAIPISSEQPFPLMPVFRYGSSAMVEGKCCIVFRIKDGWLV